MMPRDWRFWAVAVLMLAAVGLCAGIRAAEIEQDLLVRAQRALAAAGIPYYGLEIDGRDALLQGPVGSPEQGDLVRDVVGGVRGVRVIRDALIVETFPETTAPPAARPTRAPTLRVQRLGDRLFVRGRLPDEAVAAELRRYVEAVGGEVGFLRLSVGGDVAEAAWMARLEGLVALLAGLDGTGRLTIEGHTAVLSGAVRDAAAGERVVRAARAVEGLTWRFDLFSPRGSLQLPGDD